MAKTASFTKRALITKANSTMVISTAVAAFVVIFSLVASKALFSQMTYQNRVISQKKKALSTLQSDLSAVRSLKNSYQSFIGTPQNILGGNPSGSGAQDGDNAKIVLDALPSSYDFPAMAASVEGLVLSQGLQIQSISGTDAGATQGKINSSTSPQPVPMPFEVRVNGSYAGVKSLIGSFERSIRPIQVQKVEMDGNKDGSMTAIIDAQTFYQPGKSLSIKSEVVK